MTKCKLRTLYREEDWTTTTVLTLLSIIFELFVSLFGALTFGNDREINAEVAAIKFVFRGACITYKNKELCLVII